MKRVWLLGLVLAGCGGPSDLMPLEVGSRWSYSVNTTFNEYITDIRVVRQAAVGSVQGYVLSGPMGESQIAWNGKVLVGERFANTRFTPPIPLLVDTNERVRRYWTGTAQGGWGKFEGTATLNQAPGEEQMGGQKIKVIKTELVVLNPKGKSIRLQTTFQPGAGIATQRQWLGGDLLVRLERQSGK